MSPYMVKSTSITKTAPHRRREDVSFAIEPGDLISEEDDLQVLLSDGEIETPDSPTGDNTIESVVLEENYRLNFDDGDSAEHFD